jgi:hypothetical protein
MHDGPHMGFTFLYLTVKQMHVDAVGPTRLFPSHMKSNAPAAPFPSEIPGQAGIIPTTTPQFEHRN